MAGKCSRDAAMVISELADSNLSLQQRVKSLGLLDNGGTYVEAVERGLFRSIIKLLKDDVKVGFSICHGMVYSGAQSVLSTVFHARRDRVLSKAGEKRSSDFFAADVAAWPALLESAICFATSATEPPFRHKNPLFHRLAHRAASETWAFIVCMLRCRHVAEFLLGQQQVGRAAAIALRDAIKITAAREEEDDPSSLVDCNVHTVASLLHLWSEKNGTPVLPRI
jgi:hypothetical protein